MYSEMIDTMLEEYLQLPPESQRVIEPQFRKVLLLALLLMMRTRMAELLIWGTTEERIEYVNRDRNTNA